MGRPLRPTSADVVYYVLNRANARRTLFEDDGNYAAFARVLGQACERLNKSRMAKKEKRGQGRIVYRGRV